MYMLIFLCCCCVLLCQAQNGDDLEGCVENKRNGRRINHGPGDEWIVLPSNYRTRGGSTILTCIEVKCIEVHGRLMSRPQRCYFEDSAHYDFQGGIYLDKGCKRQTGRYILRCSWKGVADRMC